MPRSFDRSEQSLRRHGMKRVADRDEELNAVFGRAVYVAIEKVLSWSLENGASPVELDPDSEAADDAIESVINYLSTAGMPMEEHDVMEAFITHVMNEAVNTTQTMVDSADLLNLEDMLAQIRSSNERALGVSNSEAAPEQADESIHPPLPTQDPQEVPLLPRMLPPEATKDIPGWGSPPITDLQNVAPDDPRRNFHLNKTADFDLRPGVRWNPPSASEKPKDSNQRLIEAALACVESPTLQTVGQIKAALEEMGVLESPKEARSRFCPPEKDRQWNCPLCGGTGTSPQHGEADTEAQMITTPNRELPETEEPFEQRVFEP